MQTEHLFLGNTVQELVSIALKLQEQGQATCYKLLVNALQQPHGVDQWKYWKVLSTCVASIKPTFVELVEVIFSFDWSRNNETTIAAYVDFLVHLNSAQPVFLIRTLETFVRNFLPKVGPNARINVAHTERICNYIHTGLKKILWIIPAASSKLWPLLQEFFPHRVIHIDMQQLYLKNLLCIMDYCPTLRERIIQMIIDKMIQIDVRRQTSQSQK
jgi:RNA polymerase I-specific transcription initiation factor RRN3